MWLVILGVFIIIIASFLESYCAFGKLGGPMNRPMIFYTSIGTVLQVAWVILFLIGAGFLFTHNWVLGVVGVFSYWIILPSLIMPLMKKYMVPPWDKVKYTMIGSCFYCQKQAEVDKNFLNPNTNEIHPICAECKAQILTYRNEFIFFFKLLWPTVPLLVLFSLISFIFVNWQLGSLIVAVAIFTAVVSILGVEHFRIKKEKKLGTYVDVKKIQWCKTCKHFKKVREFDKTIDGLWRAKTIPDASQIPCQILKETNNIWEDFFGLEESKRTLYPNNCPFWTKRKR